MTSGRSWEDCPSGNHAVPAWCNRDRRLEPQGPHQPLRCRQAEHWYNATNALRARHCDSEIAGSQSPLAASPDCRAGIRSGHCSHCKLCFVTGDNQYCLRVSRPTLIPSKRVSSAPSFTHVLARLRKPTWLILFCVVRARPFAGSPRSDYRHLSNRTDRLPPIGKTARIHPHGTETAGKFCAN